jgi:hypothetical protein
VRAILFAGALSLSAVAWSQGMAVLVRKPEQKKVFENQGIKAESLEKERSPLQGWPLKKDRVAFLKAFPDALTKLKAQSFDSFEADLLLSRLARKSADPEALVKEYPFFTTDELKTYRDYFDSHPLMGE